MPAKTAQPILDEIRRLVNTGKYTYPEIAEKMGLSRNQVAVHAQRMGLSNTTYANRTIKHKHLREPVLRYYKTHTFDETRKHFGLSANEMKSCLTVAYMDPKLKHLRKDTRRHDGWSAQETRYLLQHSGLVERRVIAKRLGRGGVHAIKGHSQRLGQRDAQKSGMWTKQVNGLPQRLARMYLRTDDIHGIKTKAGPSSKVTDFRFIIVPWVMIWEYVRRNPSRCRHISEEVKCGFRAMARFQMWIYGTHTVRGTVVKMRQAIKGQGLRVNLPYGKRGFQTRTGALG